MSRLHYMRRYTIVAPIVRNDGTESGYPAALRDALLAAGIDGWTEYRTTGSWRGKRERGITFEIYLDDVAPPAMLKLSTLGDIARRVMPDQEAIQVTADAHRTALLEA